MKKIVLIEDDMMIGAILQNKFAKIGKYEVFRAIDGVQGLKLIDQHEPDLVMTDLMLPKKNGFEVLQEISIKNNQKKIRPYVIVLSNLSNDEDRKKALDLGGNEFFVKSDISIDSIVERVNEVLA